VTPSLGAGVLWISASGFLVELHILFNRICSFLCGIIASGVLCYLEICKSVQVSKVLKTHTPLCNIFSRKKYFPSYFWNLDEGLPNLIEALLFAICWAACKPLRLWQQIMCASSLATGISWSFSFVVLEVSLSKAGLKCKRPWKVRLCYINLSTGCHNFQIDWILWREENMIAALKFCVQFKISWSFDEFKNIASAWAQEGRIGTWREICVYAIANSIYTDLSLTIFWTPSRNSNIHFQLK